jgi:hypothetical protein
MVRRIEFTVSGARWRKKETFASPLPETEATHSTFDTDPAAGGADAITWASDLEHYSAFAMWRKKTYLATSSGEPNPEAL